MPRSQLSQITVYPAKSLRGISLTTSFVEQQGLTFDRRFMLARADGSMITARQYPQLVKIDTALLADGVRFSVDGMAPLVVRYAELERSLVPAQVFNDKFEAYSTTEDANAWFSAYLAMPVTLRYCGETTNRYRAKVGHTVSFADGYPLLIISEGSLTELNRRCSQPQSMNQFRPNLVVSGDEPFIEDSWKRIRIGEVEFEVVKPCERCIFTTVNPQTGVFNSQKEPLKTLATFRANEAGGVFFGQNLIAKNEGVIRQGDVVEVIEYKEKEHYNDIEIVASNSPLLPSAEERVKGSDICDDDHQVTPVTIMFNGATFIGNNTDTLLEQIEAAGLTMPYRCRAGLCGACRIHVEQGDVTQSHVRAMNDAERARGYALACSCVPTTDVVVNLPAD